MIFFKWGDLMKKEELLSHIDTSNGNVRILDLSSKEEAEDQIFTAQHLDMMEKSYN